MSSDEEYSGGGGSFGDDSGSPGDYPEGEAHTEGEVTYQSWGQRLGNSIAGVVVGFILFIAGFPLLWWNEGRAVRTAAGIQEARGQVVDASAQKIDPANDKKLVHLTGDAASNETLIDPEFQISSGKPALKLRRAVEMFQWKETSHSKSRKKLGGGEETYTEYTYKTDWSGDLIDSSHFHNSGQYRNPAAMRFAKAEQVASDPRLGAYRLTPNLLGQMTKYAPIAVNAEMVEKLPAALRSDVQPCGSLLCYSSEPGKKCDPAKPRVGDVRVKFEAVFPGGVSVLAQQNGETFGPWRSKSGTTFERLSLGSLDTTAMLGEMEDENAILKWVLRLVGFLIMAIGIVLVLNPLKVLADVLPILGDVVGMGLGLVAFLVAGCCSLVTIALAWLAYRPVLSIGLLLLAGGAFYLLRKRAAVTKAAAPQQ